MVNAGKWLRNFLSGKKEKEREKDKKGDSQPPQVTIPKEKKRWSFGRSVAGRKDLNFRNSLVSDPIYSMSEGEINQKREPMAVPAAVAPAEDPAIVSATHKVIKKQSRFSDNIQEAAAIKIQAVFRSHLARKALRALRSLVKLQALVRGYLVRKQATATLRCMQALLTVQARTRAERIRIVEEAQTISQRQSIHRKPPQDARFRRSFEMDRSLEENARVVEMDLGDIKNNTWTRNNYSLAHTERNDSRFSSYYGNSFVHPQQLSPAPSGITDMSPKTCSGHLEDFSFTNAAQHSSPHYLSAISISDATHFTDPRQETTYVVSHGHPFCPSYMANTESSKAKARSQSAPKQRPDTYERQTSRRRASLEGRNIPRGVKMQRSSSHVGSAAHGYGQYPWFIKLDGSNMSLRDSECGSTSTVLTNANYCRSLVGLAHELHI